LCVKHDALCISDEVYEWLVYDGKQHIRIASLPGMWDRTVIIGSAGKTFSVTGWKVGWTVGPNRLLQHLRTVHQNSVYHCATAAQDAVARGFQRELEHYGKPDSYFVQLPRELQQKRDQLVQSLVAVGMKPIIPEGTYFLVADISEFKSEVPDVPNSDEPYDSRFAKWMVKNKGLAAIPLSAFYCGAHKDNYNTFIRFCFAKAGIGALGPITTAEGRGQETWGEKMADSSEAKRPKGVQVEDRKVNWRRWKQERKAEKKKWKELNLLKKLEKQRMRELAEKQAEEEQ
ncbi:hypothetical protein CIB84_015086, partial [Bambusicola thoracicus]